MLGYNIVINLLEYAGQISGTFESFLTIREQLFRCADTRLSSSQRKQALLCFLYRRDRPKIDFPRDSAPCWKPSFLSLRPIRVVAVRAKIGLCSRRRELPLKK